MPLRVTVDQHGATLDEREQVRAAALAEAERLGLGRPPDVDHRLAHLLTLLGTHERAVDLRELTGSSRSATAAASGRDGAIAVLDGDWIALAASNGDHIVTDLLQLLPPAPPGAGRTCTVRSDVLATAMRTLTASTDSHESRTILREAHVRPGDIEHLLHTARSGTASGSIGVHRDRRLIGSVGYTDTPQGRYLTLQHDDQANASYTTVRPADLDWLRRHILGLLGSVAWT